MAVLLSVGLSPPRHLLAVLPHPPAKAARAAGTEKSPGNGRIDAGYVVQQRRCDDHVIEGYAQPPPAPQLPEGRHLVVALGEVGQQGEARIHGLALLDRLRDGRVLLDLGVVDHEVLHGGLVYEEVRAPAAQAAQLPEGQVGPCVAAVGQLVAGAGGYGITILRRKSDWFLQKPDRRTI